MAVPSGGFSVGTRLGPFARCPRRSVPHGPAGRIQVTPPSASAEGLRALGVKRGRNPDRPERQQALHVAKVTGATLAIAKLDRLSRNAAFLLTLRDSGVRFAAVDRPKANNLRCERW